MNKSMLENKIKALGKTFGKIDKESLVVIKGHLLIEESLNHIIENFVNHPNFAMKAKLSFYQKIQLARSMSVDQESNSMWLLIEKFNSLRNDFAHRLESDKRIKKIEEMVILYKAEMKDTGFENDFQKEDLPTFLALVVGLSLGFLSSFENEVDRFRNLVNVMNKSINKIQT